MRDKNFSFLHNVTDEDKNMLARVLDWARMAEDKYMTKHSFFLDERQADLCKQVLESVKYENYILWGGYDNAERQMLCVFPPLCDYDKNDFPIVPITFSYREMDKLTHRDFLGSLMALQIKRECVGDILVGRGKAVVFVTEHISSDALSVQKIGRIGVKSQQGFDESLVVKAEFREIEGTVASLRADSVLSLAIHSSREKSASLIKGAGIEINHVLTNSPKQQINVGDKFTVRGSGKFVLQSVNGTTKKDRVHITVCKYI